MMRMIRRFLRPYQGFVVPVGMLVLCFIVTIFGIIPGARQTFALFNQINDARQEVSDLRAKATLLGSLDEATLFNQLSLLSSVIPVDKSVPTILSTIDGVGAATDTIFSSLQLTSPGSLATEAAKRQTTEEAALGSYLLPFTLTMEGGYQQLRNTLASLTSSRRLLRIKNFSISFANSGVGRSIMSMDAFYAPLPKSLASGTKKLVPLTQKEDTILTQVSNLPLLSRGVAPVGVVSVPHIDPFSP